MIRREYWCLAIIWWDNNYSKIVLYATDYTPYHLLISLWSKWQQIADKWKRNFINKNMLVSIRLVCSLKFYLWEIIIGLDNGLAPNRWQAII